jgi:molybdopterin molybdotransferase
LSKLKGFEKLTYTYEALRTWLENVQIQRCREDSISVNEALNRVLAEDIVAKMDLPRFDRSAADGYAVNAEDTRGTSQTKPLIFALTQAEELSEKGSRQAKQVWTGNPLPKGANAVVMLEKTKAKDGKIEIWVQLAPYDNVSRKGEDIKQGEVAMREGTRLKPHHLGLIAALGIGEIKVVDKPRIGILATGNELAEVGSELGEKQVFETNRIMLSALCCELDAEPLDLGLAKDDVNEIAERITMGLKVADAVITTGGTSVGGLDLVPDAVNKIGKPGVIIHGIAMRPAMPTALGGLENKPVLILSGNPVAAIIGFEVFARPMICKMLGMKKEESRPTLKATMTKKIPTALGRKTYVRVRVFKKNEDFFAEPVSARGSGAISTMTRGNAFVIVPENREGLIEGEQVTVQVFGAIDEE